MLTKQLEEILVGQVKRNKVIHLEKRLAKEEGDTVGLFSYLCIFILSIKTN